MEDITDSFKKEIEWDIILQKMSSGITSELNIKILEKLKYFEVDSINDLKNHYEELSKLSSIELSLKNDDDKNNLSCYVRDVIYNYKYLNLIGREFNHLDNWLINMNLNLVRMDGVHIRTKEHIKKESFQAFELNIENYHNEIEGVFVYFNNMRTLKENDISEKQINKVSSFSNLFDIDFKLFPENTEIGNIGYTHRSGEKLYVIDIWGSGKRNKEEYHTPTGSNVSSSPNVPSSQLVTV